MQAQDFMRRALALAAKARPISPPNPSVGCVIEKDGIILGEGFTQAVGSDHAEIQAIKDANAKGYGIEGATVYVTLEPCSHYGRTPPCALRLIKEKVARGVIACLDPNPLVAGKGKMLLEQAGIAVEVGLMQDEAWQMNAGFMTRMTEHRPWVRMKLAMSLDGLTALPDGTSQWITSAAAREDGRRYRSEAGAVLTGIGTVLADDPQMTARLDGRLCPRQPLKVVCDSDLRIAENQKIFDSGKVLVVCARADSEKVKKLTRRGVEVLAMPDHGRVNLKALLAELARREVNEVHVEAGATLSGAFWEAGLVDELVCYVAPKVLGAGRPAMRVREAPDLTADPDWQIVEATLLSPDVRLILRKRKK